LFSLPPGTKMFQFSGFASILLWILCLQHSGFPHSDIRGYNGYLLLPAAYRSLSRPSSPLRAKAFAMRPFLLFSNIILLISLLLPICQRTFLVACSWLLVACCLFLVACCWLFLPQTAYLKPQTAHFVENKGVEPLTPCVQGRCSGQLS
jgi:hypothetical protein